MTIHYELEQQYYQLYVLTSNCMPSSVDWGNSLFLPSMFEVGKRNSLGLFRLIVAIILLHIHHHLSGHSCLQSPTNNDTENCDHADILHFQTISDTSLTESILVKLLELIMRFGTLLESFLVDQVCFATVALILIFLRPSDVEGCLCHSDSLCLHVPVNVQGLGAVLCLMTHVFGQS